MKKVCAGESEDAIAMSILGVRLTDPSIRLGFHLNSTAPFSGAYGVQLVVILHSLARNLKPLPKTVGWLYKTLYLR